MSYIDPLLSVDKARYINKLNNMGTDSCPYIIKDLTDVDFSAHFGLYNLNRGSHFEARSLAFPGKPVPVTGTGPIAPKARVTVKHVFLPFQIHICGTGDRTGFTRKDPRPSFKMRPELGLWDQRFRRSGPKCAEKSTSSP